MMDSEKALFEAVKEVAAVHKATKVVARDLPALKEETLSDMWDSFVEPYWYL